MPFGNSKPYVFQTDFLTFEAFAGSFVKPDQHNVNWRSNDGCILFKQRDGVWHWFVTKQTDKQEKTLARKLGLQASGFKTLKAAAAYVGAAFPWLDVYAIKRASGHVYTNPDNVTIIQNGGSGRKHWDARYTYNKNKIMFRDINGEVIGPQSTRLALLRSLWEAQLVS